MIYITEKHKQWTPSSYAQKLIKCTKLPPIQLLNQKGTDQKTSSIETMCTMNT